MSNLKINDDKKKGQKVQKKEIGNVGLLVQGVIALLALVFGIITLMEKSFMVLFESLLCLELIVMGINNYTTYKKKYMTAFYIIVGILLAVSIVLEIL